LDTQAVLHISYHPKNRLPSFSALFHRRRFSGAVSTFAIGSAGGAKELYKVLFLVQTHDACWEQRGLAQLLSKSIH
jgi:hypothetical protein